MNANDSHQAVKNFQGTGYSLTGVALHNISRNTSDMDVWARALAALRPRDSVR